MRTSLLPTSLLAAFGYDYIVVGGGPSGIIMAERLAEANKKVLLLERSVTGFSFDVGNIDYVGGYLCSDTEGTAACILGGGVSVNYMVFVHPPDHVQAEAERLYLRNPGSSLPSADSQRYDQVLYIILANFFSRLGWRSMDISAQRNEKHGLEPPRLEHQGYKPAGPLRTYLPQALQRDNFSLRMNAKVTRVVRDGSRATGVELIFPDRNNTTEIIPLAPRGRVVLSAGALSSPRILFNSSIGPSAQIETARRSGVAVPPTKDWIHLLRWGALTQGKHRLVLFTSNVASDGIARYYQGSQSPTAEGVMTITAYITHGLTSTGVYSYLQTAGDARRLPYAITALRTGLELQEYTNTSAILSSLTAEIHYAGTTRMGLDNSRYPNGTAVVDMNTKVYRMDNLYIVHSGFHPDLASVNNQAYIMVGAENAVQRILSHPDDE
ncbi:FAD/NAD(P)-binding domain-containing protein [Aspergillus brunneoviolaceus CBS 621.78]|uniref:FAD/NAD(P)-binding domain-containing protein n=1 Tax=Aspergillus brunneoviolaceus CBS 621.78 TaxID=1450534 RepID=A0ACD1G615_9EURO|nr:FAD/NAD(P)-binding domain-containing protein [Aspergillus brunneoviolaceus CBS 621.78]RAH44617.1 FAD/NAD(P)-binding domain-containing protein [Aspergillus brunneoviolaceus CBS 621.78]